MFDKDDCGYQESKPKCCKDKIILEILLILFIFVIGVIVGALTEIFTLIGTATFIVIAVALGILTLIKAVIILLCCNNKKC